MAARPRAQAAGVCERRRAQDREARAYDQGFEDGLRVGCGLDAELIEEARALLEFRLMLRGEVE